MLTVKDRVFSEPAPGLEPVSIGFLILHVSGGAYALVALKDAWSIRPILELVVNRTLFFQQLHIPWHIIPVGLALVTLLAVVKAGRTLWRWRQCRPEPDVGLRLRALLFVVVTCVCVNAFVLSTPETFSGPFRLRFPINAQFSVAFAYGAYALWFLLLPPLRRVIPSRLRLGLDVLAMNAALVVILAEIGLRVVVAVWPPPLLVTSSITSQIRRDADRQLPGSLRFGFPMNRGGHYDTEFVVRFASRNRIVVSIGDSFSYGTVPHAYHFTTVAERELPGVEIHNMGYPGTGPGDYLYLLKHEALAVEPDLVVIQLFLGNDLTTGSGLSGSPRWYDADRYLLAIVLHRLQIMRRAKLVDVDEVTESSDLTAGELTARYPWLTNPLLEAPALSREVFLQLETRNARSICLPDQGVYERLVDTLVALKSAAGSVALAFVLIPDRFQVEDDLWEEVVRRSDQPLDRHLAQRRVVEVLESLGWPVLDLLPLLRAVEPMEDGRRHLYHLQDAPFNARGNEVAGRALARFVDSLLGPQGRGASHTTAQPPPAPVSLPLHVDVGDSTARQWMRSGWDEDEEAAGASYTWSDRMRSVLTVPLPTGTDIRMDFEVLPFLFRRSPRQRVLIVLNGTVIEEVWLRRGLKRYSVILPAEALVDATDILEFRYAYARAPSDVVSGAQDIRTLAAAWYSIDFVAQHP